MKITLKIVDLEGKTLEATAIPVDFMAWERHSKSKVSQLANGAGMEDMLFLAWSTLTRSKAISEKFEDWSQNVAEIEVLENDPKATAKAL